MLSFPKVVRSLVWLGVFAAAGAMAADKFPGIGRTATPAEVAAWDIDVRADFKGLPAGSGSVSKGQDVWEARCASCHGVFGESNEFFMPLIGGTSAQDVKSGHVANLQRTDFPARTTLMKLSTVSTLWDYINRAMPWNEPKSLSTDDVYAVTAFLLNLGNVVPENFTLSDKNIAEVQALMPNRKGMTTKHDMWPGKEFGGTGKADTKNVACMKNCAPAPAQVATLPDFARDAHGNLAQQNRLVGAQHGVDTTRPEGEAAQAVRQRKAQPTEQASKQKSGAHPAQALLQKNACTACHAANTKLIGPAFAEIAKKYAGQADGVGYLVGKIRQGGTGVWGDIPMPAQTLDETEARSIADWLMSGAPN